jgi:hypothetical protein
MSAKKKRHRAILFGTARAVVRGGTFPTCPGVTCGCCVLKPARRLRLPHDVEPALTDRKKRVGKFRGNLRQGLRIENGHRFGERSQRRTRDPEAFSHLRHVGSPLETAQAHDERMNSHASTSTQY